MVMTDPIADLLTRIRNANAVRHEVVEVPSSNLKKAITNILLQEGYIKEIDEYSDGIVPMLRISLKYGANKEKVITRGAYKGYKKWERSFWKTTPLKNVIELNDIPSKRKYYETQITGN